MEKEINEPAKKRVKTMHVIFHITVTFMAILIIIGLSFYVPRAINIYRWSVEMKIDYDTSCYAIRDDFDDPVYAENLRREFLKTCEDTDDMCEKWAGSGWRAVFFCDSYVWFMILIGLVLQELSLFF